MQASPSVLRPQLSRSSGVVAIFTTRHGGVSEAPFHSLNLGLSSGDERMRVLENREVALAQLGAIPEQMAIAGQVHGADVKTVEKPGIYAGFDGLVTAHEGVVLAISAADCAAVLLADSDARVVGACHSGWRGTVGNVVHNAVVAMRTLGAVPSRISAYVSPCISQASFEVGPEVAVRFHQRYVSPTKNGSRPHVDLKAAIADQLVAAGLDPSAIEISPHCTMARTDTFFSYRGEHGMTGRMMGLIMLTED